MDVPREQWIARPELTRVEITMERLSRRTWSVSVIGRDLRKRKRLWHWKDDYRPTVSALAVGESMGHLIASVVLDEPASKEALDRCLLTSWEDVPLWPDES